MRTFIYITLSILLVVSPYAKGLFFDYNLYPFELVIFLFTIITLIFSLLTKESLKLGEYGLVLLLPISILLSLINAESPQGTIDLFLRWLAYSCFFILLYWSLQDERKRKYSSYIFYIHGITVSLVSILLYFNVLNYEGAIVNERLGGPFQYPNTLGAVSALFFMYFLMKMVNVPATVKYNLFYFLPGVLFPLVLLMTESRGALLVFLIVAFITLFFLTLKKQIKYIVSGITTFFMVGVCFLVIDQQRPLFSMLIILLVSATHIFLLPKLLNGINQLEIKRIKRKHISITASILFLLTSLDFYFKGTLFEVLQNTMGISFSLDTFKERFVIWKDSLGAFFQSPAIGYGGDGWGIIFTQFQTYPYQTNNLHNGYLEWLIHTGLIGFIVFIGIIVFLLYRIEKSKQLEILSPLSILLLHSLIDFNFSFGAVWFIMIWLLATGVQPSKTTTIEKRYNWIFTAVFSILLLIPSYSSYKFIRANAYYEQAADSENIEEQIIYLQKATEYAPWNVDLQSGLGQTYAHIYIQTGDPVVLGRLNSTINRVIELEPNNMATIYTVIQFLENTGQIAKANKLSDRALTIDSYNSILYEKSIQYKTDLAINEKSTHLAREALNLYQRNVEQYEKMLEIIDVSKLELYNSRNFEVTDQTKYLAALSSFILGEYDQALNILIEIEEDNEQLRRRVAALKTVVFMKKDDSRAKKFVEKYKNDGEFHSIVSELKRL